MSKYGSIHIRICHNDDLVIAKLVMSKSIAVSFGKSTSECIDHGLDLCVGKHLVNAGLLHIQDLSSDRQDCLVVPVSGCLCRTARRISLYDKNLTFFCIPLSQFASFPLLSNEYFCFVRRFVFAFSSVFRIFAAFSAQDNTFFSVSTFRSKYRTISSPVTFPVAFAASGLSSFVLVCPSNRGSGC